MTLVHEDYYAPKECEICGSENIVVRIIVKDDGWAQLRWICLDCGHSNAIAKAKNLERRENTSVSRWAMQVRKTNPSCKICGSQEDLEAHHIIPVSHSKKYMYWPSNGITLCKRCHWLVHNKEVTL